MFRRIRAVAVLTLSGCLAAPSFAADKPAAEKPAAEKPPAKLIAAKVADPVAAIGERLYQRVSSSFVAVKYTWDFELRRQDLIGPGVVISEDGLVMVPIGVFNPIIPDAQMKDFKIVIPSQEKDADEVEADFIGRDERTGVAFLRPAKAKSADDKPADAKKEDGKKDDAKDEKEKKSDKDSEKADAEKPVEKKPAAKATEARKWTALKLENVPVKIGQRVWSVGVLPEAASYKPYLMEARVSVHLRGETPQVLVSGALSSVGSIVFNDDGKTVGYVNGQAGQGIFLMNDNQNNALAAIMNPPKFFTPIGDILLSLEDPPIAGKPMDLPWMGVPSNAMSGLTKDVADVYGLANQPAVQIGDIIPDSPAAKAGIQKGDVIIKVNGKALERGDEPDEVPIIMRRDIGRMKPGSEVKFSVIRKRGQPAQDITVKLETAPKPPNQARRYYAEDLGFGVREMVFIDTYQNRLQADAKGVMVSLIKPQSSAQTGGLRGNGTSRSDMITSINGQPVNGLEDFQKLYEAARKEDAKKAVVFVVRREGKEDTVRIEPPQ